MSETRATLRFLDETEECDLKRDLGVYSEPALHLNFCLQRCLFLSLPVSPTTPKQNKKPATKRMEIRLTLLTARRPIFHFKHSVPIELAQKHNHRF